MSQQLAIKKEYNLVCLECGAPMKLRKSKYGVFYGCSTFPKCKGAHSASSDGKPLGTPANKMNRLWRILAHDKFDAWWKANNITRSDAYLLLSKYMGLPTDKAHMGQFSIVQCQIVIEFILSREARYGKSKT